MQRTLPAPAAQECTHEQLLQQIQLERERLGMPSSLTLAYDKFGRIVTPEFFAMSFENFLDRLMNIINEKGPINIVVPANGSIIILDQLLNHLVATGFTNWDKINLVFATKEDNAYTGEAAYANRRNGNGVPQDEYLISKTQKGNPTLNWFTIFIDDVAEYLGAAHSIFGSMQQMGFKLSAPFQVYVPGNKILPPEKLGKRAKNSSSSVIADPNSLVELPDEPWLLGNGLDGDIFKDLFVKLRTLNILTVEQIDQLELSIKSFDREASFLMAKNRTFSPEELDIVHMSAEEILAFFNQYIAFMAQYSSTGSRNAEEISQLPIHQLLMFLDAEQDPQKRLSRMEGHFRERVHQLKGQTVES